MINAVLARCGDGYRPDWRFGVVDAASTPPTRRRGRIASGPRGRRGAFTPTCSPHATPTSFRTL